MVLARSVYDSKGFVILDPKTTLKEEHVKSLQVYALGEIIIEDPRVSDVPVQPLISPEREADAIQAIRQLMTESAASKRIHESLLEDAAKPIYAMARDLFPDVIGEANVSGCHSAEEFNFVHPVKVAGVSLLIGRRLGYNMVNLTSLGVAALFMNVGYVVLPPKFIRESECLTEKEYQQFHKHPWYGSEIIKQYGALDPAVSKTILQHHERWDGHGHPNGLKAEEISNFARILAVVDTYFDLVSDRPHRRALMPNQAIEFILAYSGELFEPDLVKLFSRQIPLYPTGVMVKLNTGEVCIVSDANIGHIGRPTVRVCYDELQNPVKEPYDLDLSDPEYQDRLVEHVLEY